jgi:hypothetical protein
MDGKQTSHCNQSCTVLRDEFMVVLEYQNYCLWDGMTISLVANY